MKQTKSCSLKLQLLCLRQPFEKVTMFGGHNSSLHGNGEICTPAVGRKILVQKDVIVVSSDADEIGQAGQFRDNFVDKRQIASNVAEANNDIDRTSIADYGLKR